MPNSWHAPALMWSERISLRTYFLLAGGLVAFQALALLAMGLPVFCRCGYVELWHANPSGPETSQHLIDWYSYTHVIHGLGFYLLLWLLIPRASLGLRLTLAIGLEVGWEIFENTPFVMERYRLSALARGYFGDSVINSVADTLAAVLGFALAQRLPVWLVVFLAITMEVFAGYVIRDNLTLNIIQLVYPNDALSRWQAGEW